MYSMISCIINVLVKILMEEKEGIQNWKILFDDDEIIRY
jgi:hypothetical protein